MSDRTLPPEALDAWASALRTRFGLDGEDLPVGLILDLARDVANGVARPAAPFSAFAENDRPGVQPESPMDATTLSRASPSGTRTAPRPLPRL